MFGPSYMPWARSAKKALHIDTDVNRRLAERAVDKTASCHHQFPARNCQFASKRCVVIGLPGGFGLGDVNRAKLVAGMVAHAYQPSGEIVSAGLQTDQHVDRAIKASLHILKGMGYLVSTLSVVQS